MSIKSPSLTRISLLARCPRCGKGKLYQSFLTIASHCPECNLHFAAREQGDGPAFFGIVIIGTLATLGAFFVELVYEPPYWVHAALWAPFIIIGSLLCLRAAKAWLLGVQYQLNPSDFN